MPVVDVGEVGELVADGLMGVWVTVPLTPPDRHVMVVLVVLVVGCASGRGQVPQGCERAQGAR